MRFYLFIKFKNTIFEEFIIDFNKLRYIQVIKYNIFNDIILKNISY